MNTEINYKNNPLNGVGLKKLVTEIVGQYGYEILYAYLNLNCFKANPSIDSSVKFLKKTTWAREKVEVFYLYEYKNLPNPSSEQFALSPRDRIIPDGQTPGEPAELSLEDAARLNARREKKSAERGMGGGRRSGSGKGAVYQADDHSNEDSAYGESGAVDVSNDGIEDELDPWAKSRNRKKR